MLFRCRRSGRTRSPRRTTRRYCRRLKLEPLEERHLLAASAIALDVSLPEDPLLVPVVSDLDGDADGVQDPEEDASPNVGDGNGDGVRDSLQQHVTSLRDRADRQYVTLAAPEGTRLAAVRSTENPSPDDAPPGVDFPVGFLDFSVVDVPVGGSIRLSMHLEPGDRADTYFAYGPTPDRPEAHWYEFLYDGTTGAKFYEDHVELVYVDGLRGDHDLRANGVIVDPGAPGSNRPSWQNPVLPENVDDDQSVTPRDALILINELNARGPRALPPAGDRAPGLPPFLDVTGDNAITALDVLRVIDYLNHRRPARDGDAPTGEPIRHDATAIPIPEPPDAPLGASLLSHPEPSLSGRPVLEPLQSSGLHGPTEPARSVIRSPSRRSVPSADRIGDSESWLDGLWGVAEVIGDLAHDVWSTWRR